MHLFAVVLAAACTIPLEPTRTSFVTTVRVGTSRPLRFLVDTGASLTVIDRSVARELGIRSERSVTALSTTGTLQTEQAVLDDVLTGSLTVARTPALVTDLPSFVNHGHLDGILGMSIFAGRAMLFDVRRRCLELDSAPPRGEPVRAHEVAGRVAIDADELNFVLDSGASFPILMSPAARALAKKTGDIEITSAAGRRQVSTATIALLRIAGITFRDVAAAFAPARDGREDAILPITLFGSVYFAANRELVIIER
jgi:predicted aspartyl protease